MKKGKEVNESARPANFTLNSSEQGSHGDGGKTSRIATPQGVVIIHSK
jgi:hypothetical protein